MAFTRALALVLGLFLVGFNSLDYPKPAQATCAFEQGLNEMTIKASGHNVYLLWGSRLGGFGLGSVNNYTLFFKKSSDDGMTFGPTFNLYSTSQQPCSTLFSQMEIGKDSKGDDNVYVVWNGNSSLLFRASADGGETFGKATAIEGGSFGRLFGAAVIDWGGQMLADSNSGVYVVSVNRTYTTNTDIALSHSIDGGKTFLVSTLGNSTNHHHQTPHVAVSGSNVYVVWSEYSDCVGDQGDNCRVKIMFAKSSDRGITFENNATLLTSGNRLGNSTSMPNSSTCFGYFFCGLPHYASIKAVGSNVYVSWLYNASEAYFIRSTDNGTTFSAPVRVSEPIDATRGNQEYFDWPFMNAYDNGRVDIGWIMDNGTGFFLESVESKDDGVHFSQAHPPVLTTWGDSPEYLLQHFAFASNGTLYSVQPDFQPGQSSEHLVFSLNSENGSSKSTVLASNYTDFAPWHPRVAATESGNVYVIWQNASSVNPPEVLQPPLVLTSSSDRGQTFGTPRVIQEALVIPEFGKSSAPLVAAVATIVAAVVLTRLKRP